MACRISGLLAVAALLAAQPARAQGMPDPQEMEARAHRIAQERPRDAEVAARAFLQLVAPARAGELDDLKQHLTDEYWKEVGQLTVQFDVVQNLSRRDSTRAHLVGRIFGLEAHARTLQRAYRYGNDSQRPNFRAQLERLIRGHFDLENQLRLLEIKDIERRLAEIRAETQRRITKRDEFVRWAVDDIIRDATRPQ
jgi:hypothetical protein